MSRKSKTPLGIMIFIGMIIAGIIFMNSSAMFERVAPSITVQSNGFWNLKKPLDIVIGDASGILSYRVSLKSSIGTVSLSSEKYITPESNIPLKIKPPRSAYAMKDKSITIIVEATDASKWNFFSGNSIKQEYKLNIDRRKPQVNIVSNSYKISKGGSAVVIFQATDENLAELSIKTNYGKEFKAQPFYKKGYYISLLAWPVTSKNFKATVVAKDAAGNNAKAYIPLYLKEKYYKVSEIKLSDRFLKGKIASLAEEFVQTQGVNNSLEQFKIINEEIRAENEKLIHTLASHVSEDMIENFSINKMYPLKNAKVVANFGDHRKYYYDGEFISESYHLGLDLASNAMARIRPQNGGDVVYSDYNGLYGNMPMIHHGLGLYTLYGHCSSVEVNSGDVVTRNETIANSGKSGYAMGDHLHFGVLVQGIEVRPQEWMDKKWMKLNITNVIKKAKKIIDRN